MELPEIRPEERTPLVEALLGIIRRLLDRTQELEETVQRLQDEIAILKGQKPRPQIKPSQLENTQETEEPKKDRKRPPSTKRPKNLHIDREERLHMDHLPEGATIKGTTAIRASTGRSRKCVTTGRTCCGC